MIHLQRFYQQRMSWPIMLAISMLLGMLVAQSQLQSGWLSHRYTLPLLALAVTLSFYLISLRSLLLSLLFSGVGYLWFGYHYHISSPVNAPTTAIAITGSVISLPEQNQQRQRFVLQIASVESNSVANDIATKLIGKKILISDYFSSNLIVHAGDLLAITTIIKPATGLKNPGTFDYAEYLRSRGIHLTAYISSASTMTKIASAKCCVVNQWRDSLRGQLRQHFSQHPQYSLFLGLALGDRSEITEDQRQALQATGTSHLLAISGLHIGLVAGAAGLLMLFLWRRSARLCAIVPAPLVAIVFALFPAFIYALLAGFTIPTARALSMLLLFAWAFSTAKLTRSADIFATALLVNLFFEPLAVMSAGFWLSYYATALIISYIKIQQQQQLSFQSFAISDVFWLQLSLTAGMSLLTIYYFAGLSIVSVLANLIAIPWASLVVVPLVLIGNLLLALKLPFAETLINFAFMSLDSLWVWIDQLANLKLLGLSSFVPIVKPHSYFLLLSPVLTIALAYKLRKWKWNLAALSVLLLSYLPLPQLFDAPPSLKVLDVRHSLIAIFQPPKENKTVIIGSGDKPYFGQATANYTLLPLLQTQGTTAQDLLLPTTKHKIIGGTKALRQAIPTLQVYTPIADEIIASKGCAEINNISNNHSSTQNQALLSTRLFDDSEQPFCLVKIHLQSSDALTQIYIVTEDQLAKERVKNSITSQLLAGSESIILISNTHRSPLDISKIPTTWLNNPKLKLIISGELLPEQQHPAILTTAEFGAITITAAEILTAIN
jgi:competence protein ComEC